MQSLTPEGQRTVAELAQRYGLSTNAVITLLQALLRGQGTMAQFDHPELGGAGQWMKGGMIMLGDMFNHALKAKVDSVCSELAGLLNNPLLGFTLAPAQSQQQSQHQGQAGEVSLFVPVTATASGQWWPAGLGVPATVGAQNNLRYAFFPPARRLAVEINGQLTLYDTQDHQISGVSQQQDLSGSSLTFTSQQGLVRLADLPIVTQPSTFAGESVPKAPPPPPPLSPESVREAIPAEDIFIKIERLAKLKQKGILTEEEFAAKKAELLGRL